MFVWRFSGCQSDRKRKTNSTYYSFGPPHRQVLLIAHCEGTWIWIKTQSNEIGREYFEQNIFIAFSFDEKKKYFSLVSSRCRAILEMRWDEMEVDCQRVRVFWKMKQNIPRHMRYVVLLRHFFCIRFRSGLFCRFEWCRPFNIDRVCATVVVATE